MVKLQGSADFLCLSSFFYNSSTAVRENPSCVMFGKQNGCINNIAKLEAFKEYLRMFVCMCVCVYECMYVYVHFFNIFIGMLHYISDYMLFTFGIYNNCFFVTFFLCLFVLRFLPC